MERCSLTTRFGEVRAERNFSMLSTSLYILVDGFRPEQGAAVEPFLCLREDGAQQLMDDLYRAGFRPTEGKVSDLTLQAQAEHIKSLREVTAKLLELEKVRI